MSRLLGDHQGDFQMQVTPCRKISRKERVKLRVDEKQELETEADELGALQSNRVLHPEHCIEL